MKSSQFSGGVRDGVDGASDSETGADDVSEFAEEITAAELVVLVSEPSEFGLDIAAQPPIKETLKTAASNLIFDFIVYTPC